VPSLIEGLQVVQGLRVVPVFLYRYIMEISRKKACSTGTTEGGRSDWAPGFRSNLRNCRCCTRNSEMPSFSARSAF